MNFAIAPLTAEEKKFNGIKFIIAAIIMGHMQSPSLRTKVDYDVFANDATEQGKLYTMKKRNKEERIKHYGKDANKFLNIPSKQLSKSLHFTF